MNRYNLEKFFQIYKYSNPRVLEYKCIFITQALTPSWVKKRVPV